MSLNKSTILQKSQELGLSLVGFTSTAALEEKVPERYRPSQLAAHMKTLLVVAKRSYTGLALAHHSGTRQYWGGRLLKRLEESCLKLAEFLEASGSASFPLSSLMVDFGEREGLDLCPAGQGSPLLKIASVEAGLGTLGLNNMLLTPEFGPRIYLGGVLTEAKLEPGQPLEKELCLGLEECGLCTAICPEDAIPRRARRSAPLSEYRGLDAVACAKSSQPLGVRRFKEYVREILLRKDRPEEVWSLVGSRLTGALWQEMIMIKEGVFTGCSACVNICPVGKNTEPGREHLGLVSKVPKTLTQELVEIENVGAALLEGHGE